MDVGTWCSYYAMIILLAGLETQLPTNINTIMQDKTAATGSTPSSGCAALSLAAALSTCPSLRLQLLWAGESLHC